MNAFWSGVLGYVAQIFGGIITQVSPMIKAELNAFLTQLYLKALATPNVFDDFAVGMLLDILAIPRPPPPS
jgi:hypothetical protein